MTERQTDMNDLSLDLFKIIMIFAAQSCDGARTIARAYSVSKCFKEAAEDTRVLKSMKFENRCVSLYSPSFWNTNGLVHRCARKCNLSTGEMIDEYIRMRVTIRRQKRKYMEKLNKNYLEALAEQKVENTKLVLALSSPEMLQNIPSSPPIGFYEQEIERTKNDIEKDSNEILEQLETFESDQIWI